MPNDVSKFLTWLDEELRKRRWTDFQLAKNANLAPSVISKACNNDHVIGWKACMAIAGALNVSPQAVLELAGHLPANTGEQLAPLHWYKPEEQLPEENTEVLAVIYYEGNTDDLWEDGYSTRQVSRDSNDGLLVTLAVHFLDGGWYTEYPYTAMLREIARITAPILRWTPMPVPPQELLAELRVN